jgi:hypothetical protein
MRYLSTLICMALAAYFAARMNDGQNQFVRAAAALACYMAGLICYCFANLNHRKH